MNWETLLPYIISGGMTLVAVIFGGKWKKLRRAMKEIGEATIKFYEITDEKSAGGKSITPKEAKEWFKEILDVVNVFKK